MHVARVFRHLMLPDWWVLRTFSKAGLQAIEKAVTQSEQRHRGELRFVVEAGLPFPLLLSDQSVRARAVELFARHGVWDTEENSGVLIYVQLIDRSVEIVADRGINARVAPDFWAGVCQRMEAAFRAGNFEGGTVQAIGEITEILARYFPASGENPNELSDAPLIL